MAIWISQNMQTHKFGHFIVCVWRINETIDLI
jgi:hypothetical protein